MFAVELLSASRDGAVVLFVLAGGLAACYGKTTPAVLCVCVALLLLLLR